MVTGYKSYQNSLNLIVTTFQLIPVELLMTSRLFSGIRILELESASLFA